MDEDYDFLYKVILVGDSAVGKTSILQRITRNEFNPQSKPTIGVGFGSKVFEVMNFDTIKSAKSAKSTKIKIQIWDTAGQERFRAVTKTYYRGACGGIIVFDLTDRDSFENLLTWLDEVDKFVGNETDIVLYILGNKSDLREERSVTTVEATDFSKRKSCKYFEVSAKDDTGVILSILQEFVQDIYNINSHNSVSSGKNVKDKIETDKENTNKTDKTNETNKTINTIGSSRELKQCTSVKIENDNKKIKKGCC